MTKLKMGKRARPIALSLAPNGIKRVLSPRTNQPRRCAVRSGPSRLIIIAFSCEMYVGLAMAHCRTSSTWRTL